MKYRHSASLLLGLLLPSFALAAPLSIEAVCASHPDRVQYLFSALDLEQPGLAAVREPASRGAWPEACAALLAYYRTAGSGAWLRSDLPAPGAGGVPSVEAMLKDTFTFYTLTATVPRRENGGLDWDYRGPNDDWEWAWGLNRHSHLADALAAYQVTGNPAYAELIDAHIRDWVLANPYPAVKSRTAAWRGLEVHARVLVWAQCFYALQQSSALSDGTRLLLLSSIPEHAHYLRKFHAGGGNWVAMEMYGLATAAACWPEFREAASWMTYAVDRLSPEAEAQVYPDGVQMELTSHYHWVTLSNFARFEEVVNHGGRTLPPVFRETIQRMWNYLACAMRPDGYGPLNNDSNRDFNRDRVIAEAERVAREDWLYIASNGQQGARPEGPPSVLFPWAGQVIMRNGYDADAHWAFFDIGPYGTGHQHRDKLHLSVMVHGRDVLVDAGRYTYVGGPYRSYFTGSASHNVFLVDGAGHRPGARTADAPVTSQVTLADAYDLAWGQFTDGFDGIEGTATHTRAVLHVRDQYWVVLDRIDTDRPREIQALWHFHPECTVETQGATVASTDPDLGNLRIVPAPNLTWQTALVTGQETPTIQGWWSREYNQKEPSTAAIFTTTIPGSTTTAWLLIPGKGATPEVEVAIVDSGADSYTLNVRVGEMRRTVTLTLGDGPTATFAP